MWPMRFWMEPMPSCLSEETAAGKYPVEAVMMMDRIVRSAETSLDTAKFEHPARTCKYAGIRSADPPTTSPRKSVRPRSLLRPGLVPTASLVSRFRPKQPILATTPNEQALDFMALAWGVIPVLIPPVGHHRRLDSIFHQGCTQGRTSACRSARRDYRWDSASCCRQYKLHQGRESGVASSYA